MKKKELEELRVFLEQNKKQAYEAIKGFEEHSKKFDQKIREIFAML